MQTEKRIGSFYLIFFLIILFVFAIFLTFDNYATTRETRATEAWANTFGPIEDLPNQYPTIDDNEAAEQLKVLAVQLGIDFNANQQEHRYTPMSSDANRLKEARDSIVQKYSRKVPRLTVNSVGSPLLLTKYLIDYRKKFDAVRDYILTSKPIVWRQNVYQKEAYWPYSSLSRITGIWDLQTLMTYQILELAGKHDYAEAKKYLDAKWKLIEPFKSRYDLESQRAAIRMDVEAMAMIRKLPVEKDWISEIKKHDYEKAFIKGFTLEGWFIWNERDKTQTTNFSLFNNVLYPYQRMRVSSVLDEVRNDIERLKTTNPCDLGRKEFRQSRNSDWQAVGFSSWDLYEINTTFAEIKEIQLQQELTSKVIQVKHGYFPKNGSEPSIICKSGNWDYFRSPNGSTTIKYRGPLELPRTPPAQFLSSFTVEPGS
jgi:hypothetical protein